MRFDTKFNCGDKGWIFDGKFARQATIGRITVEYTKVDQGCDRSEFFGSVISNDGDNFDEQPEEYREVYMCVETGIGSGSLHTYGKHIFLTEDECLKANAERIAEREEQERQRKEWQQEQDRERLAYLRDEVKRLESRAA
jgi:hypothetical protein